MAATLGVDLRWRVVRAIEDEGLSIREAGDGFVLARARRAAGIGCGARGDVAPGRKGNPGRSRLDAHAAFLLAMIDEGGKDITLVEMAERLQAETGAAVDPSTIRNWLKKRGITFKNVWPAPLASWLLMTLFGRAQTYPA